MTLCSSRSTVLGIGHRCPNKFWLYPDVTTAPGRVDSVRPLLLPVTSFSTDRLRKHMSGVPSQDWEANAVP